MITPGNTTNASPQSTISETSVQANGLQGGNRKRLFNPQQEPLLKNPKILNLEEWTIEASVPLKIGTVLQQELNTMQKKTHLIRNTT